MRKYKEVMDKLEVTEEMKERILKNVQEKFPENSFMISIKPALVRLYGKYIAIAASFLILLAGAFIFPNLIKEDIEKDPSSIIDEPEDLAKEDPLKNPPLVGTPGGEYAAGGIEEKASIEELSDAVHFDIADISELPFKVSKCIYQSYWGEMAEIIYTGKNGQTLRYRKQSGDEDISGDYNTYTKEKNFIIDDKAIILKGNGKNYQLAIWTYKQFSYSLYCENGLSRKKLIKIISETE